jgi:hypothetical protein
MKSSARLLFASAATLISVPVASQAAELAAFTVRNTTPATICKILVGPHIVADTYAVWVKAFSEANSGNLNALQDPYDISNCRTPAIPSGYKGVYQQIWSFDVGQGIKPGNEATFDWLRKAGLPDNCILDVILTINTTDPTGSTTSGVYMKNQDFCSGAPRLIIPTSENAKMEPTPN